MSDNYFGNLRYIEEFSGSQEKTGKRRNDYNKEFNSYIYQTSVFPHNRCLINVWINVYSLPLGNLPFIRGKTYTNNYNSD